MGYHCLPILVLIRSGHLNLLNCNCLSSTLAPNLRAPGGLESPVCGLILEPLCLLGGLTVLAWGTHAS